MSQILQTEKALLNELKLKKHSSDQEIDEILLKLYHIYAHPMK